MSLTRNELLRQIYEQECHNLLCYSKTYGMNTPKDGYEKEWKESNEKVELLKQMLDELPKRVYVPEADKYEFQKTFIGSVSEFASRLTKTDNPHPYIENLTLSINGIGNAYSDREDRIFEIDHELGIKWFLQDKYDIERHQRYDLDKSTDLKVTVEGTRIVKIEWAVEPTLSEDMAQRKDHSSPALEDDTQNQDFEEEPEMSM